MTKEYENKVFSNFSVYSMQLFVLVIYFLHLRTHFKSIQQRKRCLLGSRKLAAARPIYLLRPAKSHAPIGRSSSAG